jgi:hypothetical protein
MTIAKRLRATVLVLATAVIGIVATGTAAQAHEIRFNHGQDIGWVTSDHRSIYVCDGEADNHGVYMEYITLRGAFYTVGDSDGSGGGCGHEFSEDGTAIVRARICEHSVGCNVWLFT